MITILPHIILCFFCEQVPLQFVQSYCPNDVNKIKKHDFSKTEKIAESDYFKDKQIDFYQKNLHLTQKIHRNSYSDPMKCTNCH